MTLHLIRRKKYSLFLLLFFLFSCEYDPNFYKLEIKESPGTTESNNWYKQLFNDKKFVEKVKSRFAHFYDNKDYLINFSNILSNKLSDSRYRNDKIWNTLGIYIFPNNPLNNFSNFEQEHEYLNGWISRRFDWLSEEINKL